MSNNTQRIDELEARLAFQEELIQQLNDALGSQQVQMEELRTAVRILSQRLKEAQAGPEPNGNPPDERPPHY